ncbi:hypothetical protein HBH98_254720 [Parastagonospora nodorum]|nr:hypothetical protein HBI06_257130 [Parastagonospora nodorum]KAH4332100.1 hypothetical protein HBH98_254720 [Parastagonospora nodorum]
MATKGKGHANDTTRDFNDHVSYHNSQIRMWPPPASRCPCSKRLHDIMNPLGSDPKTTQSRRYCVGHNCREGPCFLTRYMNHFNRPVRPTAGHHCCPSSVRSRASCSSPPSVSSQRRY